MQVSAQPLSREQIRVIAKGVRKQLNLINELKFPIVEVIELLASSGEGFNYEVVSEDEMNDTYGTTNTVENVIKIRENVYEGAILGNPRDRFTLCHELGHFLLHQPNSVSFARGEIPKYCDPEWQANVFAAELLAPYYLVKDMDAEEIASRCGISYTSASIQKKYY